MMMNILNKASTIIACALCGVIKGNCIFNRCYRLFFVLIFFCSNKRLVPFEHLLESRLTDFFPRGQNLFDISTFVN